MSELHVLHAEPPAKDLVRVLEEALEMAREGKLSSVGLCAVYRDGTLGSAWSQAPSIGLLIASAARLQYRLQQTLDE